LIYVILGMHKSGTTLVSQILHQSGINMVDEAISADASYDQGNFYERQSTRQVNEAILKPKSLSLFDIEPLQTLEMSAEQRSQMQTLIRDCAQNYPDWGFKDPRTCLTYPLWASALPEHKIIAIYRSPEELWQRQKSLSRFRVPYFAWQYVKRWCESNERVLDALKTTQQQFLILDYRSLMENPAEFERLQSFVGQPLKDCRNPKFDRHRSQPSTLLKMATWLVHQQTGAKPQAIIQEIEALRIAGR
jgi:Sulfotransferase family